MGQSKGADKQMTSLNVSSSVTTSAHGSLAKLFSADREAFGASYCRKPFILRHNLAGHSLFDIPALVELSRRLPEEHVKYNAGNIAVTERLYRGPGNGLSIQETIRRIEECGSWMVLKFVEQDAQYNALLNRCLDEMEEMAARFGSKTLRRQAFIFVTSPRSVTPYHADPEHGFLLQIRGAKTIKLVDNSVISEQEYEKYFGEGENPFFKPECNQAASAFDITQGFGVHVPFAMPHWVENGDGVSVSFSITFRTKECERKNIVYAVNNRLRKRGLKPKPYGQSSLRDSIKFNGFRVYRKVSQLLGKQLPESIQY